MLIFLSGDPLLTLSQTLAFGTNARGRSETDPLHTALAFRYPAAFAAYGKQVRAGRIKPGQFWLWRESRPNLLFMAVRDTPFSITRVRHVESVALTLARDYRLHNIHSLAIAPLGLPHEWTLLRHTLYLWLAPISLPLILYETYIPNLPAEEHSEST